jgi:hypothetical protein
MARLIGLLFLILFCLSCTTHRILVVTRQWDGQSYALLNRDLAGHAEYSLVPDSVQQRRDWETRLDSLRGRDVSAAELGESWHPTFGTPLTVKSLTLGGDSARFVSLDANEPASCSLWRLQEIVYDDTHRSVPLGMLRGLGIGAAAGPLVVLAIMSAGNGIEGWSSKDWQDFGNASLATAVIGGLIGTFVGTAHPIVITKSTHILLMPGARPAPIQQ